MESELPILLYLFSFALALGAMVRMCHQLDGLVCVQIHPADLPNRNAIHR
ncbi:hypothetical protein [Ruegeria meonggei]